MKDRPRAERIVEQATGKAARFVRRPVACLHRKHMKNSKITHVSLVVRKRLRNA